MSWAEMNKMGYATIIVDTSTMSVGDTVRVKSVFNPTHYLDKQVVTVGTPLTFDLGFIKDYVKICMVQTINDTPTEIGGVYKTVDYGQTLFIDVIDKTTLGGIQGILNAHQESSQLAIGDEIDITVNGSPWTMQIAGIDIYNSHEVILTSKNIWNLCPSQYDYTGSSMRQAVQAFYNIIDNNDKSYIKQVTRACRQYNSTEKTYSDYCYVLGNKETVNAGGYGVVSSQIQMPLFVTAQNRIKTYNGTANIYMTSDDYTSSGGINCVSTTGNISTQVGGDFGVVPSFTLLADS